ncbi:MAG: hypothetical protein JWP97_1931 [Labilithrix sp.]|nr:hypothetical protein [Labilithrix sp.]
MNACCLVLASLLSLVVGCGGTTYQASAGTALDVDGGGKEVDDADVLKAFQASPQIGEKIRVAYFTFDGAHSEDTTSALASVPNVASVYPIPTLLVTGQRRFQEPGPLQALSIKKLRLLAARGHADVLVVFDHGYRGGGVNGWAALNVLLVPMLFTPWMSNRTESYAQAHVIDVRNGYVYGEVSAEEKGGSGAVTIYGPSVADVADEQWPRVLGGVKVKLGETLRPTLVAAP